MADVSTFLRDEGGASAIECGLLACMVAAFIGFLTFFGSFWDWGFTELAGCFTNGFTSPGCDGVRP